MAVLFAVVMFLSGVVVVLFPLLIPSLGPAASLVEKLGLAFIVTGVVVVFQETVIKRWDTGEIDEQFTDIRQRVDSATVKIDARCDSLDNRVQASFSHFEESYGTKALAIRLVALQRAGHDSYHHWLVHTKQEELFFAGHSVLHRVQIDMDRRGLGKLEQAIVTKVLGGSTFRLIFLDPTWDFIRRIAEGEGQTYEKMMTDLAVTLGICKRLWREIEKHQKAPISGSVDIRVCKEVQQYAFHSITNREDGTTNMLVGLYFANALGMNSPLFSVEHKDIQDLFANHFVAIANRSSSTRLLEFSPPICHFNHDFYHHCRKFLSTCGVLQTVIKEHCPE
jgi:hypothetical protein